MDYIRRDFKRYLILTISIILVVMPHYLVANDKINNMAQMYKLLWGKYQEHSKNKNNVAWKHFIQSFRGDIEPLRSKNADLCYGQLDMMSLQAGKVLYRKNYPPKDYNHFKSEFIKCFINAGGSKTQLMTTNEKIKGKDVWYVINEITGKGYITNKKPQLKKNEISITQQEMELYTRYDKEMYKYPPTMEDDAITKAISNKWNVPVKKLEEVYLYGDTIKQALQSGKLVDKR